MSAKDMFYPKDTNFSNAQERSYAREELIYNVTEDLLVIMENLNISKKDLAKNLGKSKSFVTQVLSGARNMTLGTLSDICFSLDIVPKVELPVEKVIATETIKKVATWENDSLGCEETEPCLQANTNEAPTVKQGKVVYIRESNNAWINNSSAAVA